MSPFRLLLLAAVCLPAAAALELSGMDRSADPCVDLYAYANRGWLESAVIPENRASWGAFDILRERSDEIVRAGLDEGLRKPLPPEGSTRRKILQYYASGLDASAMERAGLQPLGPFLKRIAAFEKSTQLPALLAHLHAHGLEVPMQFQVRQDPRDSNRYIAELVQGGLGLPEREAYFRDDPKSAALRETYVKHLARLLELAGDSPEIALRAAKAVLDFETALARASMTPVERRDVDRTINRRSAESLAAEAGGFDWGLYLTTLGLKDTRDFNVAQLDFMKAVARMATQRPPAEWRAYLRAQVLRSAASRLPEPFAQAAFDFQERVLNGVQKRPERAIEVIRLISGRVGSEPMGPALGEIFVERAFPPEAKASALALVSNVKAALADRLKTLEWMSPQTRARALEKLEAMRAKIGYPDRWRDYSDAQVGAYPFVENWLRAAAYAHRRDLARIGAPVDRDEWFISAHIVNATYGGARNEITFPAAILQPPFFDAKADDAVNYGGIGMVIGHEITHGFDDRGRRFDASGNFRDWWTAEDARRYLERAARIEKQYGAFIGVDGIPVNGKLTLGENISDIGGAKIAYLGLQKALEGKPRPLIDGLTPDQRFFLSLAQIWRSRYREERERLLLRTDGHSPPRFRVAGAIAHMPEFARAFSCDPAKTVLGDSLW
jgi:putative endopeptidase